VVVKTDLTVVITTDASIACKHRLDAPAVFRRCHQHFLKILQMVMGFAYFILFLHSCCYLLFSATGQSRAPEEILEDAEIDAPAWVTVSESTEAAWIKSTAILDLRYAFATLHGLLDSIFAVCIS